jgi:hypothetical protein
LIWELIWGSAGDLLVQHHRHAPAHVLAGEAAHQLGALVVHLELDHRAIHVVPALVGVGQVLAGDQGALLEEVGLPVALRGRLALLVLEALLEAPLSLGRQGQLPGQAGGELLQVIALGGPQHDQLVGLPGLLLAPAAGLPLDRAVLGGDGGGHLLHVLALLVVDDLELELGGAGR